jgi:hypothetical protein
MEDAFLEPNFVIENFFFFMESFILKFYKNLTAHCSLFPYTLKEDIKGFQLNFKTFEIKIINLFAQEDSKL